MLETLFSKPAVQARHRAAPLASAREEFLSHCALQGYSRTHLKKIAWMLLVVVHTLPGGNRQIGLAEVKQAARCRAHLMQHPADSLDAQSTEQLFVHVATDWLRFLKRLAPSMTRRPFPHQVDAFARFMGEERGLSPVTITSRCQHIEHFLGALRPRVQDLRAISIAKVDAYLAIQAERGWSRPSIAVLASDLRSFFRYAEAQHWCNIGMSAAIEGPRIYAAEGLPRGPTWEQVQQLIASTEGDRPVDIRDRPIVMLLALYGLRRGEVARLHLENIDWVDEALTIVRPKQRRIERYPLIKPVGDAIVRYLREVRARCVHRELFLALSAPRRPLSPESVTHIVHSRLIALGIQLPSLGAHCLRHACAQHLLERGFSLKQIGDQLGHRSASTTLLYAKIDLEGLRQVAELDLRRLL